MSEAITQRHSRKPSVETIKKLSADEMSSGRKGDFAELYAVTWLWDQGYEVFRNYGSNGIVDMIAWHKETNEFILVDVKTMSIDNRWPGQNVTKGRSRTPEQKEKGVRILKFDAQTRNLHFMEHKE